MVTLIIIGVHKANWTLETGIRVHLTQFLSLLPIGSANNSEAGVKNTGLNCFFEKEDAYENINHYVDDGYFVLNGGKKRIGTSWRNRCVGVSLLLDKLS